MSPSSQRPLRWSVLGLATLVILGIYLQVYFIGVYIFGSDPDALDAHTGLGNVVFGLEFLVLLATLGAFWKMRREIILAVALLVAGAAQIALVEGDNEWVRGFHAVLALVLLILSHAIVQHAVRGLGMGTPKAPPAA
jgi:hypothetical protein